MKKTKSIRRSLTKFGTKKHKSSQHSDFIFGGHKLQLSDYPLSKFGFPTHKNTLFLARKTFEPQKSATPEYCCSLFQYAWEVGIKVGELADSIICQPACKGSVQNSQNYSCF